MSNNPNPPSMPSAPRPADIARYNDWAARNGEPLFGAGPPAPAVPRAKGKARAKDRSRTPRRPGPGRGNWGQAMPNPHTHGHQTDEIDGGGWIRGTYARDRNIYARRSDGVERMLLQWTPRLGKFRATKDGRDYYKHNKQQFIIMCPPSHTRQATTASLSCAPSVTLWEESR